MKVKHVLSGNLIVWVDLTEEEETSVALNAPGPSGLSGMGSESKVVIAKRFWLKLATHHTEMYTSRGKLPHLGLRFRPGETPLLNPSPSAYNAVMDNLAILDSWQSSPGVKLAKLLQTFSIAKM